MIEVIGRINTEIIIERVDGNKNYISLTDLARYKNKSNPEIELTIKILIYIYGLYIIDIVDILFLDYQSRLKITL